MAAHECCQHYVGTLRGINIDLAFILPVPERFYFSCTVRKFLSHTIFRGTKVMLKKVTQLENCFTSIAAGVE